MKVTDRLIRGFAVATVAMLLFGPERFRFPMVLLSFAMGGVWAILYPPGVLGWAKTAHPSIDVEDRSIWWLPRFIGGAFLCLVLVLSIAFHG